MRNPPRTLLNRKRLFLFTFVVLPLFLIIASPRSIANSASTMKQKERTVTLPSFRPHAAPVGDASSGHKLFMGNLHFQNGGPPCMGCHNVGSNGILGGGALGPDLTNVAVRRSQSQLAEILANPVSVAKPIYSEHPLTAEEQADLLAFLNASVGQRETNREGLVIGISLIGFLAAVGLVELVYHRRLRGVRKPMLRKTYAAHR